MSETASWATQLALLMILLAALHVPLGNYLARVYTSPKHLRVERWIYRAVGVDGDVEQRWPVYLRSLLVFSVLGLLLLYGLQRLQPYLPWSTGRPAVPPAVAFNTAASFVTNTNWQSYQGDTTMGNLVQMTGLTVQNFVSAAVGIAVAIALVRGLARRGSDRLGNFWVDLVRGCLRVLLPISVVAALIFVASGVIQNLDGFREITTLAGNVQFVPGGPVASQEAIKILGTNGGGFFNANSAHPFENPTALTNLLQIVLLLVIPFSLPRTFGVLVGDRRQGLAVAAVMAVIFIAAQIGMYAIEFAHSGTAAQLAGAAMEGKEQRFGIPGSALYAVSTTMTSTGAVNSMHDSYTALGGGITLLDMQLGEVTPGGVGSGLYGMLVMAMLAVFLAGLMVGRTPEYLGKRLGPREIKLAALYILIMPMTVLGLTGAALVLPGPRSSILNAGPHGLSEVLYAFTSATNNNGSAFAGLNADTGFYTVWTGIAMLIGRFVPIAVVLALAGSLVVQQRVPATSGTLPTHRPQFVGLLIGVILIVTGLTFMPALALGPLAEGLT